MRTLTGSITVQADLLLDSAVLYVEIIYRFTCWVESKPEVSCTVILSLTKIVSVGTGCGTVDIAVASDSEGPGLESSHRQLLLNKLLLTVSRKDENK